MTLKKQAMPTEALLTFEVFYNGELFQTVSFNSSLLNGVCGQLLKCALDYIGRWSVGGRLLVAQVVAHNPVRDAECGRCFFLGDAFRLQKATQVSRGRVVQ